MATTARTHTVPGVGRFDTVSFTVRGRVTQRDYVHRRDVAGEADLVVKVDVWRLIRALGSRAVSAANGEATQLDGAVTVRAASFVPEREGPGA